MFSKSLDIAEAHPQFSKEDRYTPCPPIPRPSPTDSGGPGGRAGPRVSSPIWRGRLPVSRGEGRSAEADAQEEERGPPGVPGDPGSARPGPWAALGCGQWASGPVQLPFPVHTGLCPGAARLSTPTRVEVVALGAAGSPGRGRGCAGPRRPCTLPSPPGPLHPACRARCPAAPAARQRPWRGLAWPGAPGSPSVPPPTPAALRWRVLPATQLPGLDSRAWKRPQQSAAASLLPSCRAASSQLLPLPAAVRGRPPLGPPARAPFSWLRAEGPARQIQVDWAGAAEGEAPAPWLRQVGWGSEGRRRGLQPTGAGSLASGGPAPPRGPGAGRGVGSVAGRAVWLPFTLFCPLLSCGCLDPSGFLPLRMAGAGAQG